MKNLWIIANWKSNKNVQQALEWIETVGPKLEKKEDLPAGRQGLKIVVCPSFSLLSEVKKAVVVGNYPIMVGSQDLSPFPEGAYTGEDNGSQLKEFVDLAIIGHSERRQKFKETNEMVEKKFMMAKEAVIIPLVCVQGENTSVPHGCDLVAYEPPNAISTSGPDAKADNPAETNKIALLLKERYGENLHVLYGGSVDHSNVLAFSQQDHISGVLVGGASLNPNSFLQIIEVLR